ncbi:hypothetical protein C0991_009119 [Blastosporella zonata]|nr:hypothetical protein C0991_009119 [Blastosporella zonata]
MIVSTFTASLIISFLSLVKSIVIDNHQTAFDIGMLLSFFAMSIHFGNIIVAGRGSALTSQHVVDDEVGHDLAYFYHYLELCEQLQFFATLVFLISVAQLTFIVFHRLLYPLVLMGIAAVGSLIVFWSVYWKVSMTFRNMMFLIRSARGLRVRARSMSFSSKRRST